MEITQPGADPANPWYVTNGLLVAEMVSGRIQTGDGPEQFHQREPAAIPVAGNSGDNPLGPTYASFTRRLNESAPSRQGAQADERLSRDGKVTPAPAGLLGPPVELVAYDAATGHNIPRVFRDFMEQRGTIYRDGQARTGPLVDPLFAFGRPISEPYWVRTRVGTEDRDVLVQLFERRVLTYTPSNSPGWEVEMGNVGQHYYRWRYAAAPWE
jgi:hypothetical protein